MNQYDITLVAISAKKVSVYTESMEEAVKMVKSMYSNTDALDFSDEDVTGISFVGREKEVGEHACEMCEFYCPTCGGCTEEEIDYCGDDCAKCHRCCPDCGGCMRPQVEKEL